MKSNGNKQVLARIREQMGDAWYDHVTQNAKHEYDKHTEYQEIMSLRQYQDFRIVQQFNHIATHLHFVREQRRGGLEDKT